MRPALTTLTAGGHLLALAYKLADRAVVVDIESEGHGQIDEHGRLWYDTRPMLDPRELPSDCIEMNRQALDYAHQRGLVSRHPQQAYLVRIGNVELSR